MNLCLSILFFFSLVLTQAYVIPSYSSHIPEQRFLSEQGKAPPRVLITSLPRSGSTFLGELFNQNPESGYLYESTRTLGEIFLNDSCAAKPQEWMADIVKKAFNCDFAPLRDYMNAVAKTKGQREYVFSWFHSEHNSSPQKCTNATAASVMMAFKEIVMWGPKLQWLLSTVGNSLKIIWLVRDVRGFVSSWMPFIESDRRENMYYSWQINKKELWMPYESCQWINATKTELEELKVLLKDTRAPPHKRMAAWWTIDQKMMLSVLSEIPKENWMLVKYEDVSAHPLEVVQQIYSFLGKDIVNEDVLSWILRNTQSGNVTDRYGTARNSANMASVYMQRIPSDKLMDIENIADSMFDYFGYSRATAKDVPSSQGAQQANIFYRV